MMKRLFQLAALAAMIMLASPAAVADDSTIKHVGYTVTDDIDVNGAAFGAAGTYSIGALLPPSITDYYKGCRVLGMRVAVAGNPGRSHLFLDKLTDNTLTEISSQYQRLSEGWNEIYFNGDGYTVEGTESLLFGYDYVETEEMVAADLGGMCAVGEDTSGAFMLYQNGNLYEISNAGMLCVQLIVDVSALPMERVAATFFDTGFKYKKIGEPLEIFAVLQNIGRGDISSLTMSWSLDGAEPAEVDVTLENPVVSGAQLTWQHVIDLPADLAVGGHTLTVRAAKINGADPGTGNDGRSETVFALYNNALIRNKVFMEVYTGQKNYNSAFMDKALAGVKDLLGSDMCVVQVHAPGTPLAVKEAAYLHDLYAYTIPSFTVNRSWFPGEAHVAYDMNDYFQSLPDMMLYAILEGIVEQDLTTPSFANLTLTTEYDAATRRLNVRANGEALPEASSIYGDIALTLMLTEDGVIDRQSVANLSTGKVTTDMDYIHNDVLRSYITPATGSKVEIVDGKFAGEYTCTIPRDYDPAALRVVGILTKAMTTVTAADLRSVDVIDANCADVTDNSGIYIPGADSTERQVEGYYTTAGLRLAKAPEHGLYIIRYTDGSARKALIP